MGLVVASAAWLSATVSSRAEDKSAGSADAFFASAAFFSSAAFLASAAFVAAAPATGAGLVKTFLLDLKGRV
jgi:hypothetical protein